MYKNEFTTIFINDWNVFEASYRDNIVRIERTTYDDNEFYIDITSYEGEQIYMDWYKIPVKINNDQDSMYCAIEFVGYILKQKGLRGEN